MKARLIKTDGTETEITPENGTDFQLEECYKHIGCDLIQVVYLSEEEIMIVDEEGLMKSNFEVNHKASRIAVRARAAEGIVGNAMVIPSSMFK